MAQIDLARAETDAGVVCHTPSGISLSEGYAAALQAMKDVAAAATRTPIEEAGSERLEALQDAKRRRALYPDQVREISRVLMDSPDASLTIHTLTPNLLVDKLAKARASNGACQPNNVHRGGELPNAYQSRPDPAARSAVPRETYSTSTGEQCGS